MKWLKESYVRPIINPIQCLDFSVICPSFPLGARIPLTYYVILWSLCPLLSPDLTIFFTPYSTVVRNCSQDVITEAHPFALLPTTLFACSMFIQLASRTRSAPGLLEKPDIWSPTFRLFWTTTLPPLGSHSSAFSKVNDLGLQTWMLTWIQTLLLCF